MKTRIAIDRALGYFLVILMGVLVLDVLWQIVSRYILKSPSSFTDELARFLLIWVGIFGSAYATGKKMHLAIDVLINRLKPENRKLIDLFINAAIAVFALTVMVIGGINLMLILLKLGNSSAALKIPIGTVYSVIPVSGLIIIYYTISDILNILKNESIHTSST